MLYPTQKPDEAPKPMGQQRPALPAHKEEEKPQELQEQFTELIQSVWDAEANWRLDNLIEIRSKQEGWD